ncbi:MAG: hypothetical protein M1152_01775 [Actinobacteria bacterium]|nr:hypothetical protein [Actinomycetota bacterium]
MSDILGISNVPKKPTENSPKKIFIHRLGNHKKVVATAVVIVLAGTALGIWMSLPKPHPRAACNTGDCDGPSTLFAALTAAGTIINSSNQSFIFQKPYGSCKTTSTACAMSLDELSVAFCPSYNGAIGPSITTMCYDGGNGKLTPTHTRYAVSVAVDTSGQGMVIAQYSASGHSCLYVMVVNSTSSTLSRLTNGALGEFFGAANNQTSCIASLTTPPPSGWNFTSIAALYQDGMLPP